MSRRRPRPQFRRALTALEHAAHALHPDTEIGRLTSLGDGLARRAWYARITPPRGPEQAWVALVPHPKTPQAVLDRLDREQQLLAALAERDLPFAAPVPIDIVEVDDTRVSITTACHGVPIDMRGRTTGPTESAQVIAEVAAAIHRIPAHGLPLPGETHASALDHARSAMASLRDIDAPFLDELEAWCLEHLPAPDAPSCLLHGDLLGQNVFAGLEGDPPAVIDWEYAGTGAPAGDLAIVTRGTRRVFGTDEGRSLLLDAYNERADHPVRPVDLRLFELTLVARLSADFLRLYPHSIDEELHKLRGLYQRPL